MPSCPSLVRPIVFPRQRSPAAMLDERYQTPKRPPSHKTNQTQLSPIKQQQQLKSFTDETLSKTDKIQAILNELTDCQVNIDEIYPFVDDFGQYVDSRTCTCRVLDGLFSFLRKQKQNRLLFINRNNN
jgi:hypothetical protein